MFRKSLIKYMCMNKTVFLKSEYCNVLKFTPLLNIHSTNITYHNKHAVNENIYIHQSPNKDSDERDFLVRLKDDPETFGSPAYDQQDDLDDIKEEKYLSEKPMASQKLTIKKYSDIIKDYLRKRKIKEAIDLLEVRMLKEDRVKPNEYIYNLIIGGCGRVGYTKKAFSLYNDMKKRALKVNGGTYTALFNACANSPWPTTDGLSRAKHLREIMIEKMYEPNITNYNAMIKAFGRGGDLETAFTLVDEMIYKKLHIKDDTLNFLLQACITDKEAGFRHALLVWRKFIEKRIKPSLYSYNLMLRCIRDCGLGDIETTKDVIDKLLISSRSLLEDEAKLHIENINSDKTEIILHAEQVRSPEEIGNSVITTSRPNLMANVPSMGNVLSLTEVTKPEDRLLLVGGCSEFLQNMIDNDCKPDIKTFTVLLDNIPGTCAAEANLLQMIKKHNLKPDIDFFNMLIKKRSMRYNYESGKEVLELIKAAHLLPNLITYGVLALGCKTIPEAESLVEEMSERNYRMNIEILGGMLTQATYHNNFPYVIHIMDMCNTEEVRPGKLFLENLENFKRKCKKISNDRNNPLSQSEAFHKGFKTFRIRYKTWLKEVAVDDTEEIHPWKQYRETSDTNVRHYKDKQEKTRFKPIHTSLFRKKTSVKHMDSKK